ncbi:MAG: hypothetical protein HY902_18390, partial [Deltaproteobacteria bacterium]|nr:hypothetical protein [Deltaproteobacteria bacterium]
MTLKKNPFLIRALLPLAATVVAASTFGAAAPALASSSDSQEIGEDQTISPEDLRELGIRPDAVEEGAQRSFAAPTRNTIRLGKTVAKLGDTVRSVAYRYF